MVALCIDRSDVIVSNDKMLLDMGWIISRLMSFYIKASPFSVLWLKPEMICRAIDKSICYGLYLRGGSGESGLRQIGLARVVTDGEIFSSIMDVYIEEEYRNRGFGKMLLKTVMECPEVRDTICILGTTDKVGFYEKFGFRVCGGVMKRDPA